MDEENIEDEVAGKSGSWGSQAEEQRRDTDID
jgi:hypothetical protein